MDTARAQALTADQWRALLERARADRLRAWTIDGDHGRWFVTSASNGGGGYEVRLPADRPWSCSCAFARYHPLCKHMVFAAVMDGRALPALAEPARTAPAPAANVTPPLTREEIAERGRLANAELFGI